MPNVIYIYVATSVLTFGAILFIPIKFTVKLWFFVNPERSLLAYAAILDPPPPTPPQPPQRACLLYVNKQTAGVYRS
jgi:hypothetical protein